MREFIGRELVRAHRGRFALRSTRVVALGGDSLRHLVFDRKSRRLKAVAPKNKREGVA